MEWVQVLEIVLPIILALVIGFLYNNSRLNDVNKRFEEVHHRIDDLRSDMNQRFGEMNQSMNQRFAVLHEDIREIKNFMMEFLKREPGYTIRDK